MRDYTALNSEPYSHTDTDARADAEKLTREEERGADAEELTREKREEVRAMLIGEDAKKAMKFEERIRRIIPHAPTAVVLREILFWQDKGHDLDGWIYKTQAEWDEKGLSRRNVDTARRNLEGARVLEVRRWYGGKLYYRVRLLDLLDFVETMDPQGERGETLNHGSRLSGPHKPDCAVRTNRIERSAHSQYRENNRDNYIPSVGSAPAPPHREDLEHEVKNNTRKVNTDTAADLVTFDGKPYNAPRVTEVLEIVLTTNDLVEELDADERGRYKAEFKKLITRGVTPEIMWSVILRIVERWPQYGEGHQLYPHAAYGDVRNLPGMDRDEFVDQLRRFFLYGLSDERDVRFQHSGYASRVNVPEPDSEPQNATQDEDEDEDEDEQYIKDIATLKRAKELIRDEATNSGRAFGEYYRAFVTPDPDTGDYEYIHEDVVIKPLWSELLHEGYERDIVAGLYRDFVNLVAELADELVKVAEERE